MALNNVVVNNSHAARSKHERLFSRGYLAVPIAFLEHYARLQKYGGLTHAEAMFILHVMSFKWGERAPFPSYATLAKRMGTGPKTVQRQAKALEDKGYLVRQKRQGRSNAFELTPLFDCLLEAVTAPDGPLPRAA
jgi:DNA-binding MarR family transcriptional regulator